MNVLPPWQTQAWQTLASRTYRGSLPHALLFAGAEGLGKRGFAEAFVRAHMCARPQDGFACGTCRACALLDAGTHPDRILVSLEENANTHKLRSEIIVEQIRALSARLAMTSQFGGWQIAVIDPADAMNAASANALLKTLEEPTASSLIVLIADQPWRLPATVRSRCQRIDFIAPTRTEAEAWLRAKGVADPRPSLDAAGGNPGRALAFANGDALQRRESTGRDLDALMRRQTTVQAVALGWAADEPEARLEYAARWFLDATRHHAADAETSEAVWNAAVMQTGFERCNRLREQLRGPLRIEPALVELFAGLARTR